LKRRVKEIIESLMEERTINEQKVGGEVCYYLTPHLHARLVAMSNEWEAETDSGATVLTLRPPPPPPDSPLVPEADALNDDDIDWASFDG
jgi:hypothetical protein